MLKYVFLVLAYVRACVRVASLIQSPARHFQTVAERHADRNIFCVRGVGAAAVVSVVAVAAKENLAVFFLYIKHV